MAEFNKIQDENGFTLMEVLISLVILAISLLSISELSAISIKANNYSKNMTTAIALAQDRMESLKRFAVENTIDYSTVLNNFPDETSVDENGQPGGIFDRNTVLMSAMANMLTTVEVSVSWTHDGDQKTVTFSTQIRQ